MNWIDKIKRVIESCQTQEQLTNATTWAMRVLIIKLRSCQIDHNKSSQLQYQFERSVSKTRIDILRRNIRVINGGRL